MTLEDVVQQFGYPAVLIGTILEGETVLLLGGFAAHRGYLDLGAVILAAFVGSMAGDQLYFEIGRRKGMAFLDRRPEWRGRVGRVLGLVQRHQTLLILGFRFLYGIRTITPFALGASGVPQVRFAALNAISAAVWATVFACLGYALGDTLQRVLGDLRHYEAAVFAAILAAGAGFWLWRRVRGHRLPATPGRVAN